MVLFRVVASGNRIQSLTLLIVRCPDLTELAVVKPEIYTLKKLIFLRLKVASHTKNSIKHK
jgi:hypothetical protein